MAAKTLVGETIENEYPYSVDDDDHCESPEIAYRHISSLLQYYAKKIEKDKSILSIYDPFYCQGSMVAHLSSLGFQNVYNKKEDFYAIQQANKVPDYDVLVTNPPYSEDHIEKLLTFCFSSNKPFFLLIPHYVYMKDYFLRLLETLRKQQLSSSSSSSSPATSLFYVVPHKRYLYATPKGRRQEKSAKYTSPFPTFWYCYLGRFTNEILQLDAAASTSNSSSNSSNSISGDSSTGSCATGRVVCRHVHQLPMEVLCEADPRKKKERNAQKRIKNKKRKQLKQASSHSNSSSNSTSNINSNNKSGTMLTTNNSRINSNNNYPSNNGQKKRKFL